MRDAIFVKLPPDLEAHLPAVEDLRFQHGSFGEPRDLRPDPSAPRAVAERGPNTAQPRTLVEVIVFGKIHYVTVADFKRDAPRYAVMLWTERDLLRDSVRAVLDVESEWRRGSFIGKVGGLFRDDARVVSELGALRRVLERVEDPRPDPHSALLRETGIVLHQVRTALAAVTTDATSTREAAIATAQTTEQYLTLVKDTSFQALLAASTFVPALRAPATEFAYRIGIVMLEAGASATGAWIAGTPRLREAFAVLKARLPQVLVDTFMSVVRGYLGPAAAAANATALIFIQQIIEFCFDVVMIGIEGKVPADEVLVTLAERRLLSIFGIFLGRIMGYRPDDPRLKHLAKLVVENTALVIAQEVRTLHRRAESEGRTMSEIALSELPWLLARVLQGVLLGALRHATAEPHANDANRPRESDRSVKPTLQLIYRQARRRRIVFVGGNAPAIAAATPGVPRPPPLGWREFLSSWSALRLNRVFLHGVLKSVEDGATVIEGRIGNAASVRHVTEPGVIFKPGWCKAKTSKDGAAAGLVHAAPGEKFWRGSVEELSARGFLVREGDGVVIHPDLIVEWSRSQPDKARLRETADHLRALAAERRAAVEARGLQGNEKADALGEAMTPRRDEVTAFLAARMGGEAAAAAALARVGAARVGITGDTDLVGVYDAVTGQIRPVGTAGRAADGSAFTQNRERLDGLNRAANAFERPSREQETALGRAGREMFAHGGAAEFFDDHGMLLHPDLGPVYGVARAKEGFVRWTVDVARGEVTVPVELVARLPQRELQVVTSGRFATARVASGEGVASRLFVELAGLPAGSPGARAAVEALDLSHLDGPTRARFADALHAMVRDGRRADVARHVSDAIALSWMKRLREAHRAENDELLKALPGHPARVNPVAVDVARRREFAKPGRLTKLRLKDRPRPLSAQVDEARTDAPGTITVRGVEAGFIARGLTLLSPENAGAFEGVVPASAVPEVSRWIDARRVIVGVDRDRAQVVAASYGARTAFEGVLALYELATRFGLDGASPKVWWELYLPVLPTTTGHVAGRLDPPSFTPALPGPVSSLLSFASAPAGRALHALRALRALPSYPDGASRRRAIVGLALEVVWRDLRSGKMSFDAVTLGGRPVAVFLAQPVDVPDDGPRVTRPLDADLADLTSVLGYQRALRDLGYLEKAPDGVLDGATRDAAAAFQVDADVGLKVDGDVGPATREALREALREAEIGGDVE